jgi:hypothetical protein
MNNDFHISKSDFVDLKNEIKNEGLGKFKNRSQKERKILKLPLKNLIRE